MGWKKLSSKYVYQNPWIKVREDKVIQPDGRESIYGILEPHNGVAIVAAEDDGQIYLVGQSRYPVDNYSWEVPTGGRDSDEEPHLAAKRELLEETGLVAKLWVHIGKAYPYAGIIKETDDYFFASGLSRGESNHDGSEDITIRKEPLSVIEDMIHKGEIMDAMTITAIYKYKLYVEDQKKK